ncbi:polysaccharide pyruvyl transferase family protein [Bifidobacterium oedipodis]|uniref:Polysaccharide pyruvyl transferase n=1 Tax=Bifidobacterium oedipodis TaxID=2675322 RepID=A0A7Y0HUX4_9BIFI|nr:polysaccharide pyruvyl transferase family protein [Bifidobacterium sp. DSM 109957]NMM95224.1 Polysaccharide pyruvyl transferase [Bifidobacterium sp. DSM 109957]
MKNDISIGIITINDLENYGNRLQNYALFVLLNNYAITSTITLRFAASLKSDFKNNIDPLKDYILRHMGTMRGLRAERRFHFRRFTQQYVPANSLFVSVKGVTSTGIKKLEYVAIGSDQVWNDRWLTPQGLSLRLGSFVEESTRIISYAASFGINTVKKESAVVFRRYLPRLRAISVREDRAKEMIEELTGLEATVVLDPTLMLTADRWRTITRGFVPENDRYVLTYFLGKPSEAQEHTIQEYAKAHGCRVRRLMDFRDPETYVAGPQDFVELFSKAEYVFADSYHACCFSLLFHKQFTVFNRAGTEGKANMNSRMETLFRLFELDSVMMDDGLSPEIDYGNVDRLLEQHRAESQAWLDKAMQD